VTPHTFPILHAGPGVVTAMPTATEHVYLRATWWGRLTAALALAGAVLMVPALVTSWARYAAAHAVIRPGVGVSAGGASVDTSPFADAVAAVPRWDLAAVLVPVVFVAATASMMVWVAKVRDDTAALAPHHRFRFSRRFAVGGLAIPFVNLWWSRQIVDDLWAAGRPGPSPWIVRAWRACLIGAFLVGAGEVATTTAIEEGAEFEDMLVAAVTAELVGSIFHTVEVLLHLGAAFLLAVIVHRIDGGRGEPSRVPAPPTSDEESAGAGRPRPILTLVMCAIPTLSATAAGVFLFATALEWSAQGPSGQAWVSIPVTGSFFFLVQAACLAAPLIKLVGEPHRHAGRMAATLCVITGIDVVFVTSLPTLVTDRLVAGLALVSLLATAVALRGLEDIALRKGEYSR
jgi:hypothetical protein